MNPLGMAGLVMAQGDGRNQLTDIARQIDVIREKSGMASAYVVLVDRNETLLSLGMGIRAWDDPVPVSDADYYRLGSVTKAFTGLALLRAEEQGCLKLTDPVKLDVHPSVVRNEWAETYPLTVAMLMEHTAGIHEMSVEEFAFNDPVPLREALEISPGSRVTAWPPGLHSEYSNSGPGMAGWLIQQACHMDFDQYIEKNVFRPLKMPSATLIRTPAVASGLVGGYNTDPKEPIEYWHLIFRPAAAANVRPIEMANFLHMLLNNGTLDGQAVFSPQQIQRMETPTTTIAARAGMDYGYGLGIYAAINHGHVFYGHGGDADGYLSRFSYSHESGKGFFVVITMFDSKPLREMRDVLEAWMLQDLPAASAPPRFELNETSITAITGTYERATIRFPTAGWEKETLSVSRRGPRIGYACDDNEWCELIPVSEELFRLDEEPVATSAIVNVDGQLFLQGEMGNWRKRNE